jgi:hypothetical protein
MDMDQYLRPGHWRNPANGDRMSEMFFNTRQAEVDNNLKRLNYTEKALIDTRNSYKKQYKQGFSQL